MYSVLTTLSEYTYFYISKNITSYTSLLVFKIVEFLQCILNVKKSNLILFNIEKNSRPISDPNIRIYIGSDELEHKETAKYFGVYFD